MTFAERFGKNLAQARRQAGLSQEDLGFMVELHRTAVGQLERGERTARMDTFVKLMHALEVEPAQLLEGLRWQPGERKVGRFL